MTLTAPASRPNSGHRPTQLGEFRARLEELAGHGLDDVNALHAWSVEHVGDFWRELLRWSGLPWSGNDEVALVGDDVELAQFFPDVRLNYAEALLRPMPGVDEDRPALTSLQAGQPVQQWTRAELRAEVQRTAAALAGIGLRTGDRIVLIGPNSGRTVIVALAATALGAPLATAAPTMGATALLGRFQQVEPAVMVVDRAGMSDQTLPDLLAGLPTLHRLLVLDDRPLPTAPVPVDRLDELPVPDTGENAWERYPFDTPLFLMFSSGTTGPPKAIVHGIGGTLLEHIKEHRLHNDMRPDDVYLHHTTTAWMVWNRCLSTLASGAHVVFYDGPVSGPESLWELVADHRVTVFGTSPAYLQLCDEAGYRPADTVDLSRLRAVLSQGAVLEDWQYDWVYDAVGPVSLWSSSGGTDILGAFVLSHPELPVPRGRIQMRSLGMDVAAVDDAGEELLGEVGELVCRNPFPSRPVGFLRDPDGSRFHEAYFVQNPGMWTHGDRIDFDAEGTSRLHGRSDGVLNIDGLRIGPSEIYAVLRHFPEITDSMAIEQRDPQFPGALRMVLLAVLRSGVDMDEDLARRIRRSLREQASAAHVPSVVAAVPELPITHNGKKSDRAARDAANGDPVGNLAALRNPACLDAISAAVAPAGVTGSAEGDGAVDQQALQDTTRLWCSVLRLANAEPDDDFSDVGGTSRQLMSLLNRVGLELGADVSRERFLAEPTLRGLAREITRARGAGPQVVRLLRGGVGRPVFLLSSVGGHFVHYGSLLDHLSTERPLYGLLIPLPEEAGRRRSITELAEEAVAGLRATQPEGPYSVLGFSFGGLVAYEVAAALEAAGSEVAYVGLLDVRPPAAALTRVELGARRLGKYVEALLTGNLGPVLRGYLGRRFGRTGRDAALDVFNAGVEVARTHHPSTYGGVVTYYLAEERPPLAGSSLTAWRRVAPHLLVTEVPGRHASRGPREPGLLAADHAETLAARIAVTLR